MCAHGIGHATHHGTPSATGPARSQRIALQPPEPTLPPFLADAVRYGFGHKRPCQDALKPAVGAHHLDRIGGRTGVGHSAPGQCARNQRGYDSVASPGGSHACATVSKEASLSVRFMRMTWRYSGWVGVPPARPRSMATSMIRKREMAEIYRSRLKAEQKISTLLNEAVRDD